MKAGRAEVGGCEDPSRGAGSGRDFRGAVWGVASGAGWGRGPWEEAAKRGRAESMLLFLWRPRRAEPGELAAGSVLEPAGA